MSVANHRPSRAKGYAAYVLGLLFLIYVTNIADRQIVGTLAEDIKRDLRLSDGQLGLLTGPAVGFFYAVLGLPMAYAADRVNRVRFMSACLAVWSAMTVMGGRATGLVQLAATRVGVSVAEAGGSPSSVSLIADYFPPRRRGGAMAIWSSGSIAGIFLGLTLGGTVDQAIGWRDTFLVVGIPGIVLAAVVLLTVREPVRGATDPDPAAAGRAVNLSIGRGFAFLWRIRLFRQTVLASAACNFCVFGVLAWGVPFAVRTYHVGPAQAGSAIGSGILLAGGVAMVASGFVIDRLARGGAHRPLFATTAVIALSALLFLLAFRAADFHVFAILFALAYATMMTNVPITWVVVQSSSPPDMRALATAVTLLVVNILSSVPAPLVIGMTSDALRSRYADGALGAALLMVPAAGVIASMLFLRAARTARRR